MFKSYPIEIIESDEYLLYIPQELKFHNIHTVAFGSLSIPSKAEVNQHQKITITKKLAEELHIPNFPLKLHLMEREGTLFIGPIVGIFTAGFTKLPNNPIGTRSNSLAKMFLSYEQIGVLPIVFGIQHINWEQGLITGFFYHQHKWIQINLPLPNVIYDRLPNRTVENLQSIRLLKKKLQEEYAIPWFNPGFFNKLDIYKKLVDEDTVKNYLPKTLHYEDYSTLKKMLDEFEYVYVKPDCGSSGKGIYQIRKTNKGIFVRFREKEGNNRLLKFTTIKAVDTFLKEHQTGSLIIQQGIPLFRTNQQNCDFRIHTNKAPDGKWIITAIASKVAGNGSPTTHLLAGGQIKTLDEIFQDKDIRNKYREKLINAARLLSECMESKINGIVAEIGFDIGIDKKGEVWLFEANAKPGHSIFKHPKLTKYERITNKYILLHAVHLMEQIIKRPEKIFHDLVLQ